MMNTDPADSEFIIRKADSTGYIPLGIVAILGSAGSAGSVGKSTFMLQIAIARATGGTAAGFTTDAASSVVMFTAEETNVDLWHRINALAGHLSDAEKRLLKANLEWLDFKGHTNSNNIS